MKQLSAESDKWMNYCEHTNTLWSEVLVTAKLGQLNLSPFECIIDQNILCDMFYSALQQGAFMLRLVT